MNKAQFAMKTYIGEKETERNNLNYTKKCLKEWKKKT